MKHQYGTKSTFARNLDPRLPAKAVVKLARKEKMKLSIAQVYNIRATTRAMVARIGKPHELTALAKAWGAQFEALAQVEPSHPARDPKAADTQLRRLIGELGLARSREIVAELARRVG